jgi:hypothetical protein
LREYIYCPIERNEPFYFKLRIGVDQDRIYQFSLKKIFDQKYIKIIEDGSTEGSFFNSTEIIVGIKLIKKVKMDMKFIAEINGKEKVITVYFEKQRKCNEKNLGFTFFENFNRSDDSQYFGFLLNELNAHEINKNEKLNKSNEKEKMEVQLKFENNKIHLPKLSYKSYESIIPNNLTIQEICNFYTNLSEETRILPLYIDCFKDIENDCKAF